MLILPISLLVLVSSVLSESAIDFFTGDWLPVYSLDSANVTNECNRQTIVPDRMVVCQCNGTVSEQHLLIKHDMWRPEINDRYFASVIDNNNNVEAILNRNCTCGDSRHPYKHLVFQRLSDNYILIYGVHPHRYTPILHARREPTIAELEAFIKDTFQDIKGSIICLDLPPN